jgi:hypothetical protein
VLCGFRFQVRVNVKRKMNAKTIVEGGVREIFWGKKSTKEEERKEKLSGPKEIPGLVQNYLVAERKMDTDLVKLLKAVVRKSPTGETAFLIRVFDESEGLAKKVQVKDYTSLDESPDLIIYEGLYDEGSKQVKLEEKKKVDWATTIFTQAEIEQKIGAIKEPGDMVFFYMARGSVHGGPLGMGAAVIELNPSYPGKKQKRYNIYVADVIDLRPVGKGQRLFDSDRPKEIARWVKDGHHKRMY